VQVLDDHVYGVAHAALVVQRLDADVARKAGKEHLHLRHTLGGG
jgi:hypothetical protein